MAIYGSGAFCIPAWQTNRCYVPLRHHPAKDFVEAVKLYLKAAEQGHTGAQYNLGVCYSNGDGVEKNCVEAMKWYRKAAEQGLAQAQYNFGVCYYHGDGVEKDLLEAVKWLRKAAEQGYEEAKTVLKIISEQ